MSANKRVAVVLAGSGSKDGSEITEAVSLLINLSMARLPYTVFAPSRDQADVFDHSLGKPMSEKRNIFVEASRIARGTALPLEQLDSTKYSAIAFPGGFGTAKNLCNFAFLGQDATLFPDVSLVLRKFIEEKKTIAALCIAPIIVALGFKESGILGVRLTLGDGSASDAVGFLKQLGSEHVPCAPCDAVFDSRHKVISTPAYMYDDATPSDIFLGAQKLVQTLAMHI
jgi:enhancing lycopene biosynthesis protein 2